MEIFFLAPGLGWPVLSDAGFAVATAARSPGKWPFSDKDCRVRLKNANCRFSGREEPGSTCDATSRTAGVRYDASFII